MFGAYATTKTRHEFEDEWLQLRRDLRFIRRYGHLYMNISIPYKQNKQELIDAYTKICISKIIVKLNSRYVQSYLNVRNH